MDYKLNYYCENCNHWFGSQMLMDPKQIICPYCTNSGTIFPDDKTAKELRDAKISEAEE